MKKDYTKIIVIVDRSGSMSKIKNDIIGGYNTFIKSQKKLKHGTCDVSFCQFDDVYEKVYENVPIDQVVDLNETTFVPRGGTALLDAVGKTINTVGEQLSKIEENDRPEQVVVVIITDGEENSSHEFNSDQVKQLIKTQTEVYSWQFTYIGANQDAWSVADTLGIVRSSALKFNSTSKGSAAMFDSLSTKMSAYRVSKQAVTYDQSDIDAQS